MSTEPKRLRKFLRGDAPTEPLPIVDLLRGTVYSGLEPVGESTEDLDVARAIDLAAKVGELMLRCGAGAPQVEGSVVAVAAAAGLSNLEVDITMQSLLIQSTASSGVPQTRLRVVRSTRQDYARLVALHELVDSLTRGEHTVGSASERLAAIKAHPRTWQPGVINVAEAFLAMGVAVIIGATWFAALLAFVIVLAVSRLNSVLAGLRLPDFYANAVGAATATTLAFGAYALGAAGFWPIRASDFASMVAGGIVVMLPGRALASAVEDVLFGFPVTGAGRLLGVMLALSGLIIGVGVSLSVLQSVSQLTGAGFVSPAVLATGATSTPVLWVALGAFAVGFSAGFILQSRRKLILPTAALCLSGVIMYAALTRVLGIGPITSTGLAAIAVGFIGRLLALRFGAPSMVLVVPATFGLLPGLTIFRGMFELVGQAGANPGTLTLQSGVTTILGALAILLAIATGSTFGEMAASPFDQRVRGRASRRRRS